MLVFSRKKGERVVIDNQTEVVVLEITKNRVKLGFAGPAEVPIHRKEVEVEIGRAPASGQSTPVAGGCQ